MAGIVDKDGNLQVTGSGGGGGNVTIVGPLPLPVSAATLPLPTNAAKETGGNLDIISGVLQDLSSNEDAVVANTTFTASGQTFIINASSNRPTLLVSIVGSWTGFIVVEVSLDNTNWVSIPINNLYTGLVSVSGVNGGDGSTQIFSTNMGGVGFLRIKANPSFIGNAAIIATLTVGGMVPDLNSFYLNSIKTQFDSSISSRLSELVFTQRINTLGQKTMANSTPVVLSSDQSAIPISGSLSALVSETEKSYTSGSSQPLSLMTDGRLRVSLDNDKMDFFVNPWQSLKSPFKGISYV